MLRTALFFTSLLGLLVTAAVVAPAQPTAANWRGWGFRHRRPSQADFVPVYATYRYHSRERHGLFGFLHKSNPTARHLGKPQPAPRAANPGKHKAGNF